MGNIIGELLLLWEELKFRKKKKAQRKFEKENNLPKKVMISPFTLALLVVVGFIIVVRIIVGFLYSSSEGVEETTKKMEKIEIMLIKEKSVLGMYPKELKSIIRNNPLLKNITVDFWNNEFHYEQLENGLSYILKSKGNDGILGTDDDIDGKLYKKKK